MQSVQWQWQGCTRRAFGVIPHRHYHSHPQDCITMDPDDGDHNVFSSNDLWKQSAFFQDPDTYESFLFAPLELDSRFCRVSLARVRRV